MRANEPKKLSSPATSSPAHSGFSKGNLGLHVIILMTGMVQWENRGLWT